MNQPDPSFVRRDKRGRRIGENWWREFIMGVYNAAWLAVDEARENYDRDTGQMEEDADFYAVHPQPRLKDFLIGYAGMSREPEDSMV